MYLIKKPSQAEIRRLIKEKSNQPLSYSQIGSTKTTPPANYTVDHNRVRLGSGPEIFAAARAALRRWEMFRLPWVQLCWPDTPLEVGATVGVLARVFGLWTLNFCRIVYVFEEEGQVEKFGFAYGTLADHAESGEERFTVEWHHRDDSVWYDLFAFSRPNQFLTRLGRPFARSLQRQFAAGSLQAMRRAALGEVDGG